MTQNCRTSLPLLLVALENLLTKWALRSQLTTVGPKCWAFERKLDVLIVASARLGLKWQFATMMRKDAVVTVAKKAAPLNV